MSPLAAAISDETVRTEIAATSTSPLASRLGKMAADAEPYIEPEEPEAGRLPSEWTVIKREIQHNRNYLHPVEVKVCGPAGARAPRAVA